MGVYAGVLVTWLKLWFVCWVDGWMDGLNIAIVVVFASRLANVFVFAQMGTFKLAQVRRRFVQRCNAEMWWCVVRANQDELRTILFCVRPDS